MNYQFFIGCDTSKSKLNFAVWHDGTFVLEQEIINSIASIRKFIKQLRKLDGFNVKQSLFCMEHTGIYNFHLLKTLDQSKANISLINAVQIKLSLGLQRGKNDIIDARRITEYAVRFSDKIELWQPTRKVVEQLQHLTVLRDRLVKALTQLKTPLKESKPFMEPDHWALLEKNCQNSIISIEQDIAKVDQKIQDIIDSDDHLKKLFKQVTSVPGVGKTTAHNIIIESNEFKSFSDPRKFACYSGIAPFENTSGSSIRGRSKVSHKANKKLKKLLHLCAMAAVNSNSDLRTYYKRKVEEGKNKMSVLNAVRNKIVHRIFAVVRNDTIYQKNYNYCLH